jgi:hypothetical protein
MEPFDEFGAFGTHLRNAVFQTGAFTAAWSVALVYYAVSHVLNGESPLATQIGLGLHRPGLLGLIFQYVLACGGAAALLMRLRAESTHALSARARRRLVAAKTAVAFLPSPVFSQCLRAYLANFKSGGRLGQVLRDVVVTWAIAAALNALPLPDDEDAASRQRSPQSGASPSSPNTRDARRRAAAAEKWRHHFVRTLSSLARSTMGFGVGCAWNSVVALNQPRALASKTAFLALLTLLAARLTVAATAAPEDALRPDVDARRADDAERCHVQSPRPASLLRDVATPLWRVRQRELLAFAARVVCAFALSDWLVTAAVYADGTGGWLARSPLYTNCFALVATALAYGLLSALVVNTERLVGDVSSCTKPGSGGAPPPHAVAAPPDTEQGERMAALEPTSEPEVAASTAAVAVCAPDKDDMEPRNECDRVLRCCAYVPCVWCCCPWLPLLFLLAPEEDTRRFEDAAARRASAKQRWLRLTADVSSLSAAIAASGILTAAIDSLAPAIGVRCWPEWCTDAGACFFFSPVVLATPTFARRLHNAMLSHEAARSRVVVTHGLFSLS